MDLFDQLLCQNIHNFLPKISNEDGLEKKSTTTTTTTATAAVTTKTTATTPY